MSSLIVDCGKYSVEAHEIKRCLCYKFSDHPGSFNAQGRQITRISGFWTGGGSSTEKVTADWKKSITSEDFNITSLMVTGDYSDATAAVSCEILIDGKSAGKNVGNGAGANASCSGSTWKK